MDIVREVMQGTVALDSMGELEQEALTEIGNVILNACIGGLANSFRKPGLSTVPCTTLIALTGGSESGVARGFTGDLRLSDLRRSGCRRDGVMLLLGRTRVLPGLTTSGLERSKERNSVCCLSYSFGMTFVKGR